MDYKLTNLPIIRVQTHPSNQKVLDTLQNMKDMTHQDCEQLDSILSHYETTPENSR